MQPKTSMRRSLIAHDQRVRIAAAIYAGRAAAPRSPVRPYWVEKPKRVAPAPAAHDSPAPAAGYKRDALMTDWPAAIDPPRSIVREQPFSVAPWCGKPFLLATLWGLRRSKRKKGFT